MERIAAGLAALGVERGDAVGLMLLNRPEFHLVDTAVLHLGATPFSVYNTSTPEQVAQQFANAGCRVVVTERHFLPVVRAAGAAEIVLVEELERLEERGASSFRFTETWQAVRPDGPRHDHLHVGHDRPAQGRRADARQRDGAVRGERAALPADPGGHAMSYLPSAHVVDRWTCHWWASLTHGFTVTSIADMRTVILMLPGLRPTTWSAVPRIWEKLQHTLTSQGVDDPEALSEEARAGLRARLGLDRVEHLGGGAAPMPIDVLRYFEALGLPIAEAWGMSELAGAGTANPPGAMRHGTCGTALPGVELKLADDAELLVRGPIVMRGYRGDPAATAAAIDDDGWLRTGDVAHIDDDGYVSIVDRKKELIISAGGKNMSPANIESGLVGSSPLIAHAVAIGDRRPYVTALVVLDPDAAVDFAAEHGIDDASVTGAVRRARAAAGDPGRGRRRQRAALARRAHQALRGRARGVARGRRAADADAEAQAPRDRAALRGGDRRALLARVRARLARPRTREVVPALGALAVDGRARDLEDHALERRGEQDLDPALLFGRGLGRLLVVDPGPDEVEQLLAE